MQTDMNSSDNHFDQSTAAASVRRQAPYLLFILLVSVLALTVLAADTVVDRKSEMGRILHYADTLLCVLFFGDFLVCFKKAENKGKYMLTWGWLDLISSIPAIDALRWGRAARVVRVLRVAWRAFGSHSDAVHSGEASGECGAGGGARFDRRHRHGKYCRLALRKSGGRSGEHPLGPRCDLVVDRYHYHGRLRRSLSGDYRRPVRGSRLDGGRRGADWGLGRHRNVVVFGSQRRTPGRRPPSHPPRDSRIAEDCGDSPEAKMKGEFKVQMQHSNRPRLISFHVVQTVEWAPAHNVRVNCNKVGRSPPYILNH
jgi:hypothetical protein